MLGFEYVGDVLYICECFLSVQLESNVRNL